MKIPWTAALLITFSTMAFAQYQDNTKEWRIFPEIQVVRYFPGHQFSSNSYNFFGPTTFQYQYSGFGGAVGARVMNRNIPGLALTLSGGAVSFYKPQLGYTVTSAVPVQTGSTAASLLAGDENMGDFFAFPISVGLQGIWPLDGFDKFRLFAGIEASGYFIDGSVAPHAQSRFGYSAIGGFGIGIVDLGVRYSQFADMNNMGVFVGFCLKPYEF